MKPVLAHLDASVFAPITLGLDALPRLLSGFVQKRAVIAVCLAVPDVVLGWRLWDGDGDAVGVQVVACPVAGNVETFPGCQCDGFLG